MAPPIQTLDQACPADSLYREDGQWKTGRAPACIEKHTAKVEEYCGAGVSRQGGVWVTKEADAQCVRKYLGSDETRISSVSLLMRPPAPSFLRTIAPSIPPTGGAYLNMTITLAAGDQLDVAAGIFHTPLDDRYPSDRALAGRLQVGLKTASPLLGGLAEQGTAAYLQVQDHTHDDTAAAVGVLSHLGLGYDLGRVRIGAHLVQSSEAAGTGSNRTIYDLAGMVTLGLILDPTVTTGELDHDALTRSRVINLFGMLHVIRAAGLGKNVEHIDGLLTQSLPLNVVVGGITGLNSGLFIYNLGQIGTNASDTTAGVIAGTGMFGGAAMEVAGIAFNVPELSGSGAALLCGSSAALPTALGSDNIWANKGAVLGCSAVQAGIGAILLATIPDEEACHDEDIQYGDPDAPDDMNPHLDKTCEARRASGIQFLAIGAGGGVVGFTLSKDPSAEGVAVDGGMLTYRGEWE